MDDGYYNKSPGQTLQEPGIKIVRWNVSENHICIWTDDRESKPKRHAPSEAQQRHSFIQQRGNWIGIWRSRQLFRRPVVEHQRGQHSAERVCAPGGRRNSLFNKARCIIPTYLPTYYCTVGRAELFHSSDRPPSGGVEIERAHCWIGGWKNQLSNVHWRERSEDSSLHHPVSDASHEERLRLSCFSVSIKQPDLRITCVEAGGPVVWKGSCLPEPSCLDSMLTKFMMLLSVIPPQQCFMGFSCIFSHGTAAEFGKG
ncbi:hypothetical protein BKA65DRAFT_487372 [Rhexocercosporidium sp. MPI-PUGE-AT-0058]|nr:hypothetical protein BKA65DRAFT_487372 [Rhexocercosporidium sp. MPI-PUGE-AT-0058]